MLQTAEEDRQERRKVLNRARAQIMTNIVIQNEKPASRELVIQKMMVILRMEAEKASAGKRKKEKAKRKGDLQNTSHNRLRRGK